MSPQTRSNRLFYLALAAVAVVGIGALMFSVIRQRAGSARMEPVNMDSASLREIYARATPQKLGPDAAPVKLVLFSDYECPACGYWATQVQPRLMQDFVKAGRLQIVYYDYPLREIHKYAFLAARAGRCAGEQGRFWEMHDHLFGRTEEWATSESAPVKSFEAYGRAIGADDAKFKACLEGDRFADVVTANRLLGEQLGVGGTPTAIVNQQKLEDPGLKDYDALKRVIEQAAGPAPGGAPPAGTTPPVGTTPPAGSAAPVR